MQGQTNADKIQASRPLDRVRVLVVDDQDDARRFVCTMLRLRGATIAAAESVAAALSRLDDFLPHVVISDISMPEQDGYDMIRELKAHSQAAGRFCMPVIAVSGHTDPVAVSLSLQRGFAAHLNKPVDLDLLVATVARLAAAAGQSDAVTPPGSPL